MKGGDEILKILAGSLRGILEQAPFSFEGLQELKLRTGKPFLCRYEGREYGFLETGQPVAADRTAAGGFLGCRREGLVRISDSKRRRGKGDTGICRKLFSLCV